ncbi:hypothetical protein [Algoriphagus sp.]|uniref:hypothetical protein n=1 Tax=Algoriphagus sp. TaxID=1872435 RepID=UPI003919642A
MQSKIWNVLVIIVIALSIGSFLILFKENKVDPTISKIPFAFWTGFLVTVVIVVMTFLASRFFPYQESNKK